SLKEFTGNCQVLHFHTALYVADLLRLVNTSRVLKDNERCIAVFEDLSVYNCKYTNKYI
ncbi:Hypothetical protein FKW44_014203, partial [Caligus rogercresseyi]